MEDLRSLVITKLSAKDLEDIRLSGGMKVYAVVSITGGPSTSHQSEFTTSQMEIQGNTNPKWRTPIIFMLHVPSLSNNLLYLHITLYCSSPSGGRHVGGVRVPVKPLLHRASGNNSTNSGAVKYPVERPSGEKQGFFKFTYSFQPTLGGQQRFSQQLPRPRPQRPPPSLSGQQLFSQQPWPQPPTPQQPFYQQPRPQRPQQQFWQQPRPWPQRPPPSMALTGQQPFWQQPLARPQRPHQQFWPWPSMTGQHHDPFFQNQFGYSWQQPGHVSGNSPDPFGSSTSHEIMGATLAYNAVDDYGYVDQDYGNDYGLCGYDDQDYGNDYGYDDYGYDDQDY